MGDDSDYIRCATCQALLERRLAYHVWANGKLAPEPICRDCYELDILRGTRDAAYQPQPLGPVRDQRRDDQTGDRRRR